MKKIAFKRKRAGITMVPPKERLVYPVMSFRDQLANGVLLRQMFPADGTLGPGFLYINSGSGQMKVEFRVTSVDGETSLFVEPVGVGHSSLPARFEVFAGDRLEMSLILEGEEASASGFWVSYLYEMKIPNTARRELETRNG